MIFVAGIYGVGKTTICNSLSTKLSISHFSASDLIAERVCEKYGANKSVRNVDGNQQALICAVKENLKNSKTILLSGHFCIFNNNLDIIELPPYVYESISLESILLLQANPNIIQSHLKSRDKIDYPIAKIEELANAEKLLSNL